MKLRLQSVTATSKHSFDVLGAAMFVLLVHLPESPISNPAILLS
jgi:hypothetical protein